MDEKLFEYSESYKNQAKEVRQKEEAIDRGGQSEDVHIIVQVRIDYHGKEGREKLLKHYLRHLSDFNYMHNSNNLSVEDVRLID